MKNNSLPKKLIFLSVLFILMTGGLSFASSTNTNIKLEPEPASNPELKTNHLKLEEINNKKMLLDSETAIEEIIDKQKEQDLKDLEILWQGTIENNPVIEFSLKKLSVPEAQRRIHSSLMAKTLSAVVSGASFIPSLMGANSAVQTSAFSAGRVAQGLINKKDMPKEIPLTDTELIELAGMIENLEDELINSYYNYKNTLAQLKNVRTKILLYSKNYSDALEKANPMEITISSSLYNNMIIEELTLEEEAKKYHIQLQRIAGQKAVKKMKLYQYDFDSALYKNSLTQGGKNEF